MNFWDAAERVGVSLAVAGLFLWFFTKKIWPEHQEEKKWAREQIEKAQTRLKEVQVNADHRSDEMAAKFMESLTKRDVEFDKMAGSIAHRLDKIDDHIRDPRTSQRKR